MKKVIYFWLLSALLLLPACGQPVNSSLETTSATATSAAVALPLVVADGGSATTTPTAVTTPTTPPANTIPTYTYEIIASYPHDPNAFTQGLVYLDGEFYEGTGLYGQSDVRRVELTTGNVLQSTDLPAQYFGEGIVIWEDRLLQITWREGKGFIYDRDSLSLLDEFEYPGEGWGLTHDGVRLIMSDGTNALRFLDPDTQTELGRINVFDDDGPVTQLNELEYVNGEIFANVWQTNRIARIDPVSGQVTGWIDLTGLLDPATVTQPVDVLNGIAYDAATDRLFVTGKLWPLLFEIELVLEIEP
jgi:glutaminyl-peptide cyclotransferase